MASYEVLLENIQTELQTACFSGYNSLNEIGEETVLAVLRKLGVTRKGLLSKKKPRNIKSIYEVDLDSLLDYLEGDIGADDLSVDKLKKAVGAVLELINQYYQCKSKEPEVKQEHKKSTSNNIKLQVKSSRTTKPRIEKDASGPQEELIPKESSDIQENANPEESSKKIVDSTKRFTKAHKNWADNSLWKRSGGVEIDKDFLGQCVDAAEDDDYLSSWLECLRLGVPWGGRGAGGRGVKKVTGESKDVLIHNLTITRGTNDLIENAVLKLIHGKKYGLIGLNGSGKTTLIRRIATGKLPGFPPFLKVQHVQQELKFTENNKLGELSPVEFVLKFDFERTKLLSEEQIILEKIEKDENSLDNELQQNLTDVYGKLEQIDAFTAEIRAEEVLRKMGFSEKLLNTKMMALSGGWKMKVCLAGALFTNPDVLLLDEPTNHLDVFAVRELEAFLNESSNFSGTALIISHDRSFINSVCDEIIVLKKKSLSYFSGRYNDYVEMKAQKKSMQVRKSDAMDKRKAELKKFITTTQQSASDRKSKGGDAKKQKQIRSRKKKLDRMERLGFGVATGHRYREQVDHSPSDYKEHIPQAIDVVDKPVTFSFPECSSLNASTLISTSNLSFSIASTPLCSNFTAQIDASSRIGLVGRNGCGKSTLVKILTGSTDSMEGLSVSGEINKDARLKIGYFSQDMVPLLPHDKSPAEAILDKCNELKARSDISDFIDLDTFEKTRRYMGLFGVKNDVGVRKFETLSGGQKSRVVFALESLSKPELLILDEPSNHLDIESIEALSSAISKFNGAILLISHDRTLLTETVDELWEFENKKHLINVRHRLEHETRKEFVDRYVN